MENYREGVAISFEVIKESKVNDREFSKVELDFIGFFSFVISKGKSLSSLSPSFISASATLPATPPPNSPPTPATLLQVLEFRVRVMGFKVRERAVI